MPYKGFFGTTPKIFEAQLLELKKQGEFISQQTLISHLEDESPLPQRSLMITFDDGLAEQYDYAFPILQKLNIPAVFFVNSSIVVENKILAVHKIHLLKAWVDEKLLLTNLLHFCNERNFKSDLSLLTHDAQSHYHLDTADAALLKYLLNIFLPVDIRDLFVENAFRKYFENKEEAMFSELYMHKNAIKILGSMGFLASHGHNHLPIGLLNKKEQLFELKQSKKILEKYSSIGIKGISFPYGSVGASDVSPDLLTSLGYVYGVTVEKAINIFPFKKFTLSRLDCNNAPLGKNDEDKGLGILKTYSAPAWKFTKS